MVKYMLLVVVMSSISLAAAATDDVIEAMGDRKLKTDWYGPSCTNSYFKSSPDFKPIAGLKYGKCCDKNKGFICATYKGRKKWSTYATCMTKKACKASGKGWQCGPLSGSFPECQYYYGDEIKP